LKKAASGVLATWPCSRTSLYAPPVQVTAALLGGLFELSLVALDCFAVNCHEVNL
jgi:hypothetical protein